VEAPKRPQSGYGQFFAEKRSEISATLLKEGLEAKKILTASAKRAGEMWKALGAAKQASYKEKSEKLVLAWRKELEAFKTANPDYQKVKKLKKEDKPPTRPAGGYSMVKKAYKEVRPPTRPAGGYSMWLGANRAMLLKKIMKEHKVERGKAFLLLYKEGKLVYDALSAEEKKQWVKNSEVAKLKFQEDMKEWTSMAQFAKNIVGASNDFIESGQLSSREVHCIKTVLSEASSRSQMTKLSKQKITQGIAYKKGGVTLMKRPAGRPHGTPIVSDLELRDTVAPSCAPTSRVCERLDLPILTRQLSVEQLKDDHNISEFRTKQSAPVLGKRRDDGGKAHRRWDDVAFVRYCVLHRDDLKKALGVALEVADDVKNRKLDQKLKKLARMRWSLLDNDERATYLPGDFVAVPRPSRAKTPTEAPSSSTKETPQEVDVVTPEKRGAERRKRLNRERLARVASNKKARLDDAVA
jgi:hypothetical protein